ncbi:MAG: Hsp20/alpha crystallin family protein [Armatimonadetes bacterium]|nr:MAG: Hsp20/alpha crystallin family protein [Armatimonadota bacterium]
MTAAAAHHVGLASEDHGNQNEQHRHDAEQYKQDPDKGLHVAEYTLQPSRTYIILALAEKRGEDWVWQLSAELQRLSDEVFRTYFGAAGRRSAWRPNVDVRETEEEVLIVVELAGVDPSGVTVEYDGSRQTLTIRGTRPAPPAPARSTYRRLEILYGDFEREIGLEGARIDAERIEAAYEAGFLAIRVPKKETSARRVSIPIQKEDE